MASTETGGPHHRRDAVRLEVAATLLATGADGTDMLAVEHFAVSGLLSDGGVLVAGGGCPLHHTPGPHSAGMLAFDHVIVVVVEDLDAAARWYYERQGPRVRVRGRHPGHGTANRIVPLGSSYIELMAVVNRVEGDSSPLGSWVRRRLVDVGEAPAALCLLTDDIERAARLTGREPLPMHRTRAHGMRLECASWPSTRP